MYLALEEAYPHLCCNPKQHDSFETHRREELRDVDGVLTLSGRSKQLDSRSNH